MLSESAFHWLFCLKFSFKLVTFSKNYARRQKWMFFSEHGVQAFLIGKIWASLGVPSYRRPRKTALAKGTPLDLPLLHGITKVFCNVTAVGLSQESTL